MAGRGWPPPPAGPTGCVMNIPRATHPARCWFEPLADRRSPVRSYPVVHRPGLTPEPPLVSGRRGYPPPALTSVLLAASPQISDCARSCGRTSRCRVPGVNAHPTSTRQPGTGSFPALNRSHNEGCRTVGLAGGSRAGLFRTARTPCYPVACRAGGLAGWSRKELCRGRKWPSRCCCGTPRPHRPSLASAVDEQQPHRKGTGASTCHGPRDWESLVTRDVALPGAAVDETVGHGWRTPGTVFARRQPYLAAAAPRFAAAKGWMSPAAAAVSCWHGGPGSHGTRPRVRLPKFRTPRDPRPRQAHAG